MTQTAPSGNKALTLVATAGVWIVWGSYGSMSLPHQDPPPPGRHEVAEQVHAECDAVGSYALRVQAM